MPKRNPVRSEGRMIHIRLSEETHKKLRIRVAEEEITIQNWVADLIVSILTGQSIKDQQRTHGKK